MRGDESGMSLVEVLVALLLVGIALVPLMQLYPNTLGFGLDAEYDMRLATAATRKTEELIGLLRVTSTQLALAAFTSAATTTDPPPAATSATMTIDPLATYVIILVGIRNTTQVAAVTIGGTPAAQILARNHPTTARRAEMWGLANPPTGLRTITVTLAGAQRHAWVAASVLGVLGATPLGATNGNNGTSTAPTVSINPRTSSTLMVGGFLWDFGSGSVTQVGAHTAIATAITSPGGNPSNVLTHMARETTPGSAGASMAWTLSGSSRAWVALAAELRGGTVVADPNGSAACSDVPGCLLVWTTSTQYSLGVQGVGVLRILTVVACVDANGNNGCDEGERQARYDTKVTSRP